MIPIEVASLSDLPALVELDRACFGEAVWSTPMWRAELVRDYARVDVVRGEVAASSSTGRTPGLLLAAIATWWFEGELHILRVATLPEARRQGLAELLLRAAILRAIAEQGDRALLEVASLNHAAITLYKKLGFEVVGCRKRYYRAPVDDAIAMTLAFDDDLGAT